MNALTTVNRNRIGSDMNDPFNREYWRTSGEAVPDLLPRVGAAETEKLIVVTVKSGSTAQATEATNESYSFNWGGRWYPVGYGETDRAQVVLGITLRQRRWLRLKETYFPPAGREARIRKGLQALREAVIPSTLPDDAIKQIARESLLEDT